MMCEWILKKQLYLGVLLDFEDLGEDPSCSRCKSPDPGLFRCFTCLGRHNYCQSCIVYMHALMPLHRVVRWDESAGCFLNTSLATLGLILDIGHRDETCPHESRGDLRSMTVVHTNGIHEILVRFSMCTHSPSPDLQLFTFRLFPATVNSPQTAFSFEVLQQFHFYHLEGKGSVYSFMNAIERLTDDTGYHNIQVRADMLYFDDFNDDS
jgi:CxC2 like cysteine cluster associated with KDZ transposases